MELQLYFYHDELNMSPEAVFEVLNNDKKLISQLDKLTDIEYKNAAPDTREPGTKAVLFYDGSKVDTEVVQYKADRRIEFDMNVPAGTLKAMINIVPVEDRSELTISAKLVTDSPVSFALYSLKIPKVKKQFNKAVEATAQK
ncbi:Polyketide cyclase / dehydrase and lipid transport [Jeotgalicoccus aerolatus]|uniref:Polyketide cyclase / dehydrase and lipid transport n=1 Tax=Jeotgalicoccus aerolatus TaxID=709510 RepID=A0ABS4HPH7_9STAP|nr:SRPBCC family protein [Jeotgalicoccus aerolatus]MBP1952840.1 hypothetical protein [Jeotgalicoccus aerolatus]NMA81172.1 SRPBCC family protein [Jeotgalicoccus aerolatus]GGE07651.1 hypothetical protein GCM10007273_20070 [Jeotgalicoccus aerolatus]CAD2080542.1 Polyketide cyclase / dehydrase and lipid transport [Jeotgalicoccus aerolatus]